LKFYKGVLLVIEGKSPNEAEMLLKSYVSTVPDNSELPSHATALEWLGKLYESMGRFSEATEEYRKSLTLDPHNKGVGRGIEEGAEEVEEVRDVRERKGSPNPVGVRVLIPSGHRMVRLRGLTPVIGQKRERPSKSSALLRT